MDLTRHERHDRAVRSPSIQVSASYQRKHSERFIEFFEHRLQTGPSDQKVILVLDHASYHRSLASLAALRLFEARLQVV